MSSIVAIVGRPNVGKSTLFNRLIGERQAIIDDSSGVTRDRQYGASDWNGKFFTVIDTGGFVTNSDDVFEAAIRDQVHIAVDEASVIIFLVDAETGITDLDEDVANILRKSNKPVFCVSNKVDNYERQLEANEFWSLGFENTFFISAMSGSGTGDLLDAVCEKIENPLEEESEIPKFAIIGQPNVGKSSLLNALVGEQRNIVTDVAGTTRDSIHTRYNKYDKDFLLIDTAGMRRKSRVKENLEFYSVMRAIKSIDEADVCILVIDATLGLSAQDMSIIRLTQKRNKGLMLLVNKWDLMEKDSNTARDYERVIHEKLAPFTDLPVIFTSALENQRIFKAMDAALMVYENKKRKITTSQINNVMLPIIENQPPPVYRGKYIKIKYITQIPAKYPAFAFFCNHPRHVKEPYKMFLENQLRKHFDFTGTPVAIFMRSK